MKSVSVVIPAYNAASTIAEAIATVRAQTVAPLEIIVVDDCSKDATLQALESLAAPDLIVIKSPINKGGSAARNRGIDVASGDYVALLDADDLWVPHKLERQLASLAAASGDAFCFSALVSTNEYGEERVLPRRALGASESLQDFMLKSGNIVQTSTLLLPRPLLTRYRFNEGLRRFQDIDFVLQLALAGVTPIYIHEPLVYWRTVVTNTQRVSAIKDPAVMQAFMAQHGKQLTLPQRLGFTVRSMGPASGILGKLHWLGTLGVSVCVGALALTNAASLLLKYSLGVRSYGALRSRFGSK
jgi:glycosyltransferase involved in cell wall biosynthesis